MEIAVLNARVSKTVTLAKVDGRSAFGRLIRQVRSDLVQHVGGRPSVTQRMLIERAATLTGYLARLDGDALSPAGMSDHRRREYLAADGALRRTLHAIGLAAATPERESTISDLVQTLVRPVEAAPQVATAPAEPENLRSDVLAPAVAK